MFRRLNARISCRLPRPRPYDPSQRPRQGRLAASGASTGISNRSDDPQRAFRLGPAFLISSVHAGLGVHTEKALPASLIQSPAVPARLHSGSVSERSAAAVMDLDEGSGDQLAILNNGRQRDAGDELDRAGETSMSGSIDDEDDTEDDAIPDDLDDELADINSLGYASLEHLMAEAVSEVENSLFDPRNASEEEIDLLFAPLNASEEEIQNFLTEDLPSFPDINRPAARLVLENLPSCLPPEEDASACSICYADMLPEESIKVLPCIHYYHEDCIIKWLSSRNTCPICRFELPADDSSTRCARRQ